MRQEFLRHYGDRKSEGAECRVPTARGVRSLAYIAVEALTSVCKNYTVLS